MFEQLHFRMKRACVGMLGGSRRVGSVNTKRGASASQRTRTANTRSEHSQRTLTANIHRRTLTSKRPLTANTHSEHSQGTPTVNTQRGGSNAMSVLPRWSLPRLLDPSCSSWSELQRSLHSSLPHVGVEAEASSVLCDAKGHLEAADFAKVGRGEA